MTLPPHYGALVDTTSVTPTTSSVTAGSTTSTDYPTTSYPVVSFFPLKHSFPTLYNTHHRLLSFIQQSRAAMRPPEMEARMPPEPD
jgi:hypothetical protein